MAAYYIFVVGMLGWHPEFHDKTRGFRYLYVFVAVVPFSVIAFSTFTEMIRTLNCLVLCVVLLSGCSILGGLGIASHTVNLHLGVAVLYLLLFCVALVYECCCGGYPTPNRVALMCESRVRARTRLLWGGAFGGRFLARRLLCI